MLSGTSTELANFFAGSTSSREGVTPSVVTNEDGSTSVVGTDICTGTANTFDTEGRGRGHSATPRTGSQLTGADADAVVAATVGIYSGTGTGTLSTATSDGTAPTSTTEDVTVSVAVTSAGPVAAVTDMNATAKLRSLSVTGTITVTIGTADPVEIPFTGTLQLRGGSVDDVRGRVYLTGTGTGVASGFTLGGILKDGMITTNRLVVSDYSTGSGGFVFQSPTSRTATKSALAMA